MGMVIRGVQLPPDGEGAAATADLVVEDGRIASIDGGRAPLPPGARDIDGRGLVALPGLVNCHNHVAMTLLRGYGADLPLDRWLAERIWPAEERLDDEDVAAGALLGCLEMLAGGITAFADMYDHMGAVADAVVRSGIRGVLARGVIGLRPGWEASLAEAEDLCRRAAAGGCDRLTAMLAPHAEYTCPREVWDATVALARGLGVPLHTHVSETAAEVEGCRERHGCSPVRWLEEVGALEVGVLVAHAVHVDGVDIALLARPGVAVSHNPVSNAKLGSGVAPVQDMLAAGVLVGLGSDGAASTDTLGLWEEMRAAGWIQKAVLRDPAALSCGALWTMATAAGAAALRLPAGCGQLAVGAPADLILVRSDGLHRNPAPDPLAALVYATRDADVVLTVVAGRIAMERGEFPGIDHQRLRADVARRSLRLLEGA